MLFAHKVVLWVMQRWAYLVRLNKRQIFFHTFCFVVEPTSVQQIFNLRGNFFSEIVRVGTSTNACELTE